MIAQRSVIARTVDLRYFGCFGRIDKRLASKASPIESLDGTSVTSVSADPADPGLEFVSVNCSDVVFWSGVGIDGKLNTEHVRPLSRSIRSLTGRMTPYDLDGIDTKVDSDNIAPPEIDAYRDPEFG